MEIVRGALSEPACLIATKAGFPGQEVVAEVAHTPQSPGLGPSVG